MPAPDWDAFVREVYPILLRDCGFERCHGASARPFHVYGPGRHRWEPDDDPFDPVREQELWISYQRARSMLVDGPGGPLLLRKVLPGGGHAGLDRHGASVYGDRDDPSYRVLASWADGSLVFGAQESSE